MRLAFLVFLVVMSALAWLVDLYVTRRWRRFAAGRPRLDWTVAPLNVLLYAMPFVMPAYALASRWWDGGAGRGIVVGLWAFHYLPRTLIALWLLVVDAAKGTRWIARWTARRVARLRADAPAASANTVAVDNAEARALAETPAEVRRVSRRDALRTAGWAVAGLPFVAVGTGLFKTVYDFEVRRVRVPVAGLPRGLAGVRIAQVSDLHAGSFFSAAPPEEALRLLMAERADLVVFTGDFVNHDAAELALVLPALKRLRADLGVFGILGNHDHYADVPDVLRGVGQTPVRMLVNQHHTVRVDGAALRLLGTDNTGFGQHFADLPRTLDGLPPATDDDATRLLLTHDPTFWDDACVPTGAALTLSGHTHGGQIGWEWAQHGVNLADLRYPRTAGLYAEPSARGTAHLYINRGLGTTGPPLRLGVHPEITLLELVAG